mgnify:CR=1 FL=1
MHDHLYDGDLLVILRHGPHGSSWLKEGLDAALVAAAFGRHVSLLFMGEGVMALMAGQQAGPLGQKGTAATLDMLEMYDIETLLVDEQGLSLFDLSCDELMLEVTCVSSAELARVLSGHRLVLTF